MATCEWADCGIPLEENARGRPRKYCADHAKASTAERKKLWKPKTGKYFQCCLDWQASKPGRRICPQHRDWNRFLRDTSRPMSRANDMFAAYECDADSPNFRVSPNPDSFEAQSQALSFDPESGTKVGADHDLERDADALLAKLNIIKYGGLLTRRLFRFLATVRPRTVVLSAILQAT